MLAESFVVHALAKVVPVRLWHCVIKVYDIVLFIKYGSKNASKYQFDMVYEVSPSQDGII